MILIGRLTRDVEVRYAQGAESSCIARYSLAVDRKYNREQQSADFINCVAFGKAAEFAERYLRQGTKIAIAGRIQTGSYTDRNGNKVYTTDIVVEEQEFAESKKTDGSTNYNANTRPSDSDGFMNIPDGLDEELPWN